VNTTSNISQAMKADESQYRTSSNKRKMIPHLPDSSFGSALINLLHETQIPRHLTTRGHPKPNKEPAVLRKAPPMDPRQCFSSASAPLTSRDLLLQALARTEATSPIMSYETMITPLLLQTIGKPVVPSSSRPSNELIVYTSGYVTFPPYQKAPNSRVNITKKFAKKIKTCLATVSNKFLAGLQAVGKFYAHGEQKWESEYKPFERETSNASVWEAIDAADKAALIEKAQKAEKQKQRSWSNKCRNYWKPNTIGQSSTSNNLALCDGEHAKNEEANIPPIPKDLRMQNNQRPERMQNSHQPNFPLKRWMTQERPERIQLSQQRHFSPPKGRMHPLERQPRRAHQQLNILPEQQAPESEEEDDLGTPWSGLETMAEEHFFGEEPWEDADRMLDEGIGEEECDGLEAGGELCLRHESCVREAMAICGA
jgi:hypothetical protein